MGAFGGSFPSQSTDEVLEWLDEFSADHWDFRKGKERHTAESGELTAEMMTAAMEAALESD